MYLITKSRAFAASVSLLALPAMAEAASTTTVLDQPSHFASGSEVPALTATNESSLGSGSWQADSSLNGSDGKQHLIYLQGDQPGPFETGGQTSYPTAGQNPRLLFSDTETVTIDDIVSFSWDTKTSGSTDWFVDLFTKPDGTDDDASWYGKNFDFTVDNMVNTSSTGGFQTHTFSASGGQGFDEADRSLFFSLSDLQSQYGDEEIMFLALGTGTNYSGFSGYLDNFQFSYQSGGVVNSRTVDFEAAAEVPLPSTFALLGVGLLSFGVGYVRQARS